MIGATYHQHYISPAVLRAREIMARPGLYGEEDLLNACFTARQSPEWADAERAEQILASLRIDAAARDEAREAQIQFWDAIIFGCGAGAASFLGIWAVAALIRAGGTFVAGM